MHPSLTFQFDRAIREYALWQAVSEDERSPAPSWWWSAALALRGDPRPLPDDDTSLAEKSYGELARRMLEAIGAQAEKPWPDEFPTRYRPSGLDEAASSAEPAAQAASVAATPF